MTTNDTDHHRNHDIDAWLDAIELLAPGNHNARTFPDDAAIVHATGPAGDLLLRRWEPGATAARIAFIAEGLDAARAAAGEAIPTIDPVPGKPGERSALIRGRLYTRSPFLGGRPLARYSGYRTPDGGSIELPLHETAGAHAVIADLARLLAHAHQGTTEVAGRRDAPTATLGSMLSAVRDVWFEERKVLGDRAAEQRDIRRWLRCGNRIIPTCSDLLRAEQTIVGERSVMIHGDLWPGHVLIEGREEERRITGLAGWTAAAAGSPVLDLAALAVHMQGWSAPLTEAIVESYADVRAITPEQRRLVPVVAALDLVARVAALLHINYVDDRMIDHQAMPVLRSGLKTLLNSLETLTTILVPDTTRRVWVPRSEMGARRGGGGHGRKPVPRSGRPMRQGRPDRSKRQRNDQ